MTPQRNFGIEELDRSTKFLDMDQVASHNKRKFLFLAILILGIVVWMGISLQPRARLSEALWYISLSLGLS